MKKVKFTQPRVTTHGAIAVGDTGLLTDREAAKLCERGQCVILEDVPEPKTAQAAPEGKASEPADAGPGAGTETIAPKKGKGRAKAE